MKLSIDLLTTYDYTNICAIDGKTDFAELFTSNNLTFTSRYLTCNGHTEYTLSGQFKDIYKVLQIIFENNEDQINEAFNASYDYIKYHADHNTEHYNTSLK